MPTSDDDRVERTVLVTRQWRVTIKAAPDDTDEEIREAAGILLAVAGNHPAVEYLGAASTVEGGP